MTTAGSSLESVIRRDRFVVLAGLSLVVALAAAYTIAGIGMNMSAISMTRMAVEMPGMLMKPAVWTPAYAALVFLMWWVMMIAMMVPSAAPAILLFAGMARKQREKRQPFAATSLFLAGYLVAWAGFSLLAAALQWGLETIGVVTGMMEIASPMIGGGLLIATGFYQFTPLKQACLRHCQHPLFFLMHHWKPGNAGALRMGLEHGIYCLACCWFLMALLFVGGIMNLLWIAGLAVYVGIEKFAADRRWILTSTGAVLTLAGLWLLARPFVA